MYINKQFFAFLILFYRRKAVYKYTKCKITAMSISAVKLSKS